MAYYQYIQWLCSFSKGFRCIGRGSSVRTPNASHILTINIKKHKGHWPLLLQSAIEGIEDKKDLPFSLWKVKDSNTFSYKWDNVGSSGYKTRIEAKEAAVKYMYDLIQEKSN